MERCLSGACEWLSHADDKSTEDRTPRLPDNSGTLLQSSSITTSSVNSSTVVELDSSSPADTVTHCKQVTEAMDCSHAFDDRTCSETSERPFTDSNTATFSLYSSSLVGADTNNRLNTAEVYKIGGVSCLSAFDGRMCVDASERAFTDSDNAVRRRCSSNFVGDDVNQFNTAENCSRHDTESDSMRCSIAGTRDSRRSDQRTVDSTVQSVNFSGVGTADTIDQLDIDTGHDGGVSADTAMLAETKKRVFACDVCDRNFAKSYNLKTHLRVHTGERPFTCSVCDKRFINGSNLKTHMRVHSGERPFRCSVCDKTFIESTHLKTHMRTHTHERPFRCKICDKTFTQSQQLKTHAQIHSVKQSCSCEVCGRKFTRPDNLKRHLRLHSDPNVRADERRFRCDVCSADFVRPEHLRRHMRSVHIGDKPFRCYVCSKHFTQAHHLQVHIRLHTFARS